MKYPPIQGGVSARSYWIARSLAQRGHQVYVVTNAAEVEPDYRLQITSDDAPLLEASFTNGGFVRVVSSGMNPRGASHIPRSKPYMTKLAALAADVIRRHSCDVVFSFYFEPYGMSAHLASVWTGVPHIVQHAGSDRGRLLNHPDMSTAYREILRRAAFVVTANPRLVGLDIPRSHLVPPGVNFLPRQHFHPDADPIDVDAISTRPDPWRSGVPVIGVMGKVGEVKGSYDLIAALGRLRESGYDFNLLTLCAGAERERFYGVLQEAGLASSTWALPLMPQWRVPGFLRRCTAVAFLERRFPIVAHRPGVPQEIMACGVCAVLSREIADKQPCRDRLRHGENVLIVEDPSDIDELSGVLESIVAHPECAEAVGAAGAALVDAADVDEIGRSYEAIFQRALEPKAVSVSGVADTVRGARALLRRLAPATMRVMGTEVDKLLDNATPNRRETGPQLAYNAMDLLVGNVLEDRSALQDVVRFERDALWTMVDLESREGVANFARPPASAWCGSSIRDSQQRIIQRSNWIRLGSFSANIEAMVAGAAEGIAALQPAEQQSTYLFRKTGNLERHVYRINAATKVLIDMCDGSKSIADVEAELLDQRVGGGRPVVAMIERLTAEGVLYSW